MNKFVYPLFCLFMITACSGTGGSTSQTPDNPAPAGPGQTDNTPEPEPEEPVGADCGFDGVVTIGLTGVTRIEAENYDICGNSFSDSDTGNSGGVYREDDVDIYADSVASNGFAVSDTVDGEFLDFTVNVERSGFYTPIYRVTASAAGAALSLSVSGTILDGSTVAVAADSGWKDTTAQATYLTDGLQTVRLQVNAGGASLDYLELAYVEDTILAPQATVNAMGIGINLGNTLDAPLEGDWAPAAQRQFLEDFANASFNHVRIPVTWDKHTATTAPYSVDTAFMDRVELVVDWALAEGSYVVLNAHHESWLKEDADNAALQERFDSIWRQVAERFKNKSSRLIFEILNEPHGMTQSQSDETNNRILEIIRQTNPTRLVIFAGNDYSSADRLLVADIPNDEYVIGNFHSYDPWPFAGQCTRRWGSEADIAELRGIYDQVKSWSEENGVAVMVNEFGSAKYDFTRPDNKCVQADRLLYLQTHASLAIEHGFAGTVWDDGGSFSFYDRANGTWGEEKDILVNANP